MKNTDKLFSIVADGGDDKQRSNKTSIAKRLAMAAVLAGQLAAPAHAFYQSNQRSGREPPARAERAGRPEHQAGTFARAKP